MAKQADMEKLQEVLSNQAERGVVSGDYERVGDFEVIQNVTGKQEIKLWRAQVTFEFTLEGRFLGVHNWRKAE